ncbi:oxidoreductase [Lactobacillaceae bacterium Melli_B3]
MKVVLITGASSGIGYDVAKNLATQGNNKVYGAARRLEKMESLKQYGVTPLKLDVTDEQSRQEVVDIVLRNEGRIDVLINAAGYGLYGPIETIPLSEAQKQMDVNVMGLAGMIQLVLPKMRKKHSGRIINISSVAGRVTSYFGGWYHASKYAVESLSDALRMEVKEFGIDIVLVEPGLVTTPWGTIAGNNLKKSTDHTAYAKLGNKAANVMTQIYGSGKFLTKPQTIANVIVKATLNKHPRTRYLKGTGSHLGVVSHAILPDRTFDWVMKKYFDILDKLINSINKKES